MLSQLRDANESARFYRYVVTKEHLSSASQANGIIQEDEVILPVLEDIDSDNDKKSAK